MAKNAFKEITDRLTHRGLPMLWPPYEPDQWVVTRLKELSPGELFDSPVTQPDFAMATEAGLLLWADCLEESHHISQTISNTTGSYWHAIMHRREPDYGNSHYWFHRVGDHPAFDAVYIRVQAELSHHHSQAFSQLEHHVELWSKWMPEEFVAMCQEAGESPAAQSKFEGLRTIQAAEIRALLDWTREQATR